MLKVDGWQIDFNQGTTINWSHIAPYDVLFCQRFHDDQQRLVVEQAKAMGKKIWLDYDDDLFNVPIHNPTHPTFHSEQNKKALTRILEFADVITVTTPFLANQLKEKTKAQIVVVPNAWNDYFHPMGDQDDRPFKKYNRFLWRGGATHGRDLEAYEDDFRELAKKYKDWNFYFLGVATYKVSEWIPKEQLTTISVGSIIKYFEVLRIMQASICLVPLHNNDFNKSKSNIGWLEATYARCATVAPNWPEWGHDGIAHYMPAKPGALFEAADALVANSDKQWAKSFKAVNEHFLLSKCNKLREQILCEF